MLNRRHLRIKVLQILYAYFQTEDRDGYRFEKELMRSIEKMYDMYLYYLLVFEEQTIFADRRIDERLNKVRPTQDDLNPNRKFANNQIFKHFALNTDLKRQSEAHKINWVGAVENDLMKKLFLNLTETEIYQEYMNNGVHSFEDDKQFALNIFKTEIANFELLHDFFENQSIYWIDDIDLVCSMVLKTIKLIPENGSINAPILTLYKDEEDERAFTETLFRKTIQDDAKNDVLIQELTENWELDRIAKMDIILLKMALTEFTAMTSVPKKVTLNEYIEISKFYSTPKSQQFINGILDKAVAMLDKEGQVKKTGRGLIN
ncbi:MAG: transcription antitermination protein NusB [Crocinitomicaceae bacterium]|jgi:N utilization substance protein B|nr:transcription antitermination protein NusB [Crocinitomicaceae bacterium]